mgnify:CR=1 FL=1
MKKLGLFIAVLAVTGCASTSSEYYAAVQKTAEANAMANKAKFDALSAIASSGDGQAASAAVMALALTQTQMASPVPQQSQALQWASVLAAPMTSLGMAWIQADTSKTISQYNAQVDLERIRGNGATQQALYGSFVDMNQATADALGNVDYTPFVDGMITLGVTGMDNLTSLGTAGFDANTTIATTGMDNLTTLGTSGFTSLTSLGTAGLDSTVTLGTAGFDTMLNMDAGNNALFSSVWTDYQSAIQSIFDAQINCSATTAADGAVTIACE